MGAVLSAGKKTKINAALLLLLLAGDFPCSRGNIRCLPQGF